VDVVERRDGATGEVGIDLDVRASRCAGRCHEAFEIMSRTSPGGMSESWSGRGAEVLAVATKWRGHATEIGEGYGTTAG